jgi:hypothetical protein
MASNEAVPDGVFSLLDTDLYKLTMQCVVLKYFATDSESVEVQFDRRNANTFVSPRSRICLHKPNAGDAPEQGFFHMVARADCE